MSTPVINNNKYEIKRKMKNRKRKRGENVGLNLSITKKPGKNVIERKRQHIKESIYNNGLENQALNDSSSGGYDSLYRQVEHKSLLTINAERKLTTILNQKKTKPISSNVYEVIRPVKARKESKKQFEDDIGFVNPALDVHFSKPTLKTIDENFEVVRKPLKNKKTGKDKGCFENPALELQSSAIAISFTPSLGIRVNFNDVVENTTSEKDAILKQTNILPVSVKDIIDVNVNVNKFKTADIDKEIDVYQNELENSMNEAKMTTVGDENSDCTQTTNDSLNSTRKVKRATTKKCLRRRILKSIIQHVGNVPNLSRK